MASGSPARAMQVFEYKLSTKGCFESGSGRDKPEFELCWDDEQLQFKRHEIEDKVVTEVQWEHVTGIWVSLSQRTDSNYAVSFSLKLTLETSHPSCPVDFAHFTTAMDGTGGDFLHFLQTSFAGRLKEGRAPSFATGSWACSLYRSGSFSARSLRLLLGRFSMGLEILYALCFFTQLHSIVMSREQRMMSAVFSLFGELQVVVNDLLTQIPFVNGEIPSLAEASIFFAAGVPTMICRLFWTFAWHSSNWVILFLLVQHVVMVMMSFDALARTLRGFVKSVMTFHKAAKKVDKAINKSKAKSQEEAVKTSKSESLEPRLVSNSETPLGDSAMPK